jgi:hypothetical protein
MEWALFGKVLSPTVVHPTTISRAMKPAWGNPHGLKIRSIGEKELNLFVAEFSQQQDMERALNGSPWLVGRHALLLQTYDDRVKPSDIKFDKMEIWVRILNLPLGWMNRHRGERAMSLVGSVKRMDVDKEGKAGGAYLRARVAIDIAKPLRRGVLLKTKKDTAPEWFDLQYEKLPFYCLSCGILGHSELECEEPVIRCSSGKLPYDVKLRAPEPKKKRIQSFSDAAMESYGSGGSSSSKASKESARRSYGKEAAVPGDEDEVHSPIRQKVSNSDGNRGDAELPKRQLFKKTNSELQTTVRKRKAKGTGDSVRTSTPDEPISNSLVVVPSGLVGERMKQLEENAVGTSPSVPEASPKKQKRDQHQQIARSAAATVSSPRRAQ